LEIEAIGLQELVVALVPGEDHHERRVRLPGELVTLLSVVVRCYLDRSVSPRNVSEPPGLVGFP
jgi:hypothetical protein